MVRERSEEETQMLRGMSSEQRKLHYISKIAEALEDIRDELREMNQRADSNPLR